MDEKVVTSKQSWKLVFTQFPLFIAAVGFTVFSVLALKAAIEDKQVAGYVMALMFFVFGAACLFFVFFVNQQVVVDLNTQRIKIRRGWFF